MSLPKRPTDRELSGKLREATRLLEARSGRFADFAKAAGELNALNVLDSNDIWGLILKLLAEIQPRDYTGGRPPQKSYEKSIEGRELFAFSFQSFHLVDKVYLKFAIKNDCFYYVSLHRDRPKKDSKSRR